MKTRFVMALMSCCLAMLCPAGESVIKDSQGMDCYVYTPDPIDPAKTYQLVVGVHGAGGHGKGAAGMKDWAQRGDVIVIGPSFETKGERPYQNGDGPHAEKLIALFRQLGKEYKLKDKMFLHGFSGGSQFSHRFVMNHPDLVCGVSSHSGGSWATDGYGNFDKKAKKIPFAISCGEKDTATAWGDAPYNRLAWYGRFRDLLDKEGFTYIGGTWPGVGHRISPGAWDLCRQCFQVATGLPGKSATEMVEISSEWKNLDSLPKPKPSVDTARKDTRPAVNAAELAKMTQAAFRMADEQEISDEKLVNFMTKYPPVLWKDQAGAEKLLVQCQRAAIAWRQKALDAKQLQGDNLRRFEEFSRGLDLPGAPQVK